MDKNTIANRQPTEKEIEISKGMGTVNEATRRIINAGGFSLFQRIIDNPVFVEELMRFVQNYIPSTLKYSDLLKWFRENELEKYLTGGSLMGQLGWQEKFYQKFYDKNFFINAKKIFIDSSRLPAIMAGLKAGCLNRILVMATPNTMDNVSSQMTEAEFFIGLLKWQEENGFQIWEKTGTGRWTGLTLAELLARGNPSVEPDEFNLVALKTYWVSEIKSILGKKSPPPEVQPGAVQVVFTCDLSDIPADQKIVNKTGEIVVPENYSYVSAISKGVRVLSNAEGIVLAAQMFAKDKTYPALNTWEWRRDLISHRDKGTSPGVSVAHVQSRDSEFNLSSFPADDPSSAYRLRLAL